ncbi:MAG: monovalent cation/H+ antiporter subunit D, partial [Candidatus Binatia bacterium]
MSDWVIVPVVWPMLTAVILLAAPGGPRRQRAVSLASVLGLVAVEIALALEVADGAVLVHRVGHWRAPFGIVLVADRLAVVMLLLASVTAAAVLLYEAADPDRELEGLPFFPLFH